jgi:RNA polymerase sigma-70 factor, ECF subfamily
VRSDEELVLAWRSGDSSAFDEIYERYHAWVTTLAFRFTRNREDALDVLQDTFTYLHRKRRDFELRSRMKTFLYPVVKHLALSRAQLARRQAPLDPKFDPPVPAASTDETAALLQGLSDVQQEVVLMRFVDGLDLQAIADALDVPLGTVKSRLHSALELLRGKINPVDFPPNR